MRRPFTRRSAACSNPETGGTPPVVRASVTLVASLLVCFGFGAAVMAQVDDNLCDEPGDVPDVAVGDLPALNVYGAVDGVAALSVSTTSCNVGTCWIDWFAADERHPVIAQNLYRLSGGRLEQVGMSWVKHGFNALNEELCSTGCIATGGQHLGVNCADTYTANLNGFQPGMGPRSGVNATTGELVWPYPTAGVAGGTTYKRLQVRVDDLDPEIHADARYFVEAQYVAADDAAAGRALNNLSHREIAVGVAPLAAAPIGQTARGLPAISAWRLAQPGVVESNVDVPGDGRLVVSSAATDVGDGIFEYEYAVFNLNSHRSVGAFEVPLPFDVSVSAVGFADADYHSGEPFDDADWPAAVAGDGAERRLAWNTTAFDVDPDANALRWSTLYNFRFRTAAEPVQGEVTLGLFRPGVPGAVAATALVPRRCNDDGSCDPGEDCDSCPGDCIGATEGQCCGDGTCDVSESACDCPADCGAPALAETVCGDLRDDDCDGDVDCADLDCCLDASCPEPPDLDGDGATCDCDDGDADIWATPGAVGRVTVAALPGGLSRIEWEPPSTPGSNAPTFRVLRSAAPADFSRAVCVPDGEPGVAGVLDTAVPAPGGMSAYLVRAENGCPAGLGSLGPSSAGALRVASACPVGPPARREPRGPAASASGRDRRSPRGADQPR